MTTTMNNEIAVWVKASDFSDDEDALYITKKNTWQLAYAKGYIIKNYADEYAFYLRPLPNHVAISVERLRELEKCINFLPILEENYQAQIAGFYNIDKTDEERKIRNAVITEYQDLIAIYKHNIAKQALSNLSPNKTIL